MENNKNYYMEEKIDNSGIANTRNPVYQTIEYTPFKIRPRNTNIGQYFTNDSSYDETLGDIQGSINEGLTVDDLRARQQSGFQMVGNALVNNLVIAGTTAVGGVIGLADGIVEAVSNKDISKLWDNPVNSKMVEWQNATREALPIYRGTEYQDKSLVEKLGTGIFWADLFQNLGYTEGMLIPGMGIAKAVSSAPKIVSRMLPSLAGAMSEASIEAIQSKNDEVTNKIKIANQKYNEDAALLNSPFSLGVLDSEYKKTIEDINEDATKAGNFVFGSNIALLTLTNNIEFGNLFSRGFGTTKRLKGALKRKGSTYSVDPLSISVGKTVGKKLVDSFTEGSEEVAQAIISNTPSNYSDYNTFNESMFNPEKRELVSNLWSALGESYANTMQDKDTAVEFASGFLIGALGVPTLKRHGFPITLQNSIIGELSQTYQDVRKANKLVDEINTRLQEDDKINSYYNGLVRHLAIQDRMNAALDAEDTYDYKTSEAAQFISDISMFDDAGDLDYLKQIINNSIDLSDEGVQSIIQETSKDGEGPFMQNGNPMDSETVRSILQERVNLLNSKIDSYVADKQSLEENYPNMDEDTLKNAIFLKQQFKDHLSRYEQLGSEIYSSIGHFVENASDIVKKNSKVEEPISNLFSSVESMLIGLENNPKMKDNLTQLIDSAPNRVIASDEKNQLKSKLNDLAKLSSNLKKIDESLNSIINNPNKSKKDLDSIRDKKVAEDTSKRSSSLKDKLLSATNLSEFRQIIDTENDPLIRDNTIKTLESEGNKMVKDYREVNAYNTDVQRAINTLDEDPTVKTDALKLLQDQFENSSNLEEMANPNSIYIDNADALYDDSLTPEENAVKFQEAQYALLRAMNQINNENRFKNRFSQDYRELKEVGKPNPNAPEKDTTGDSGTTTIPSVNNKSSIVTEESPVGDVTLTQVIDENKEVNDKAETPQTLDDKQSGRRPYYRPSIPELHIQASKEGDFRPFNVVAAEREKGTNFDELYNYLRDKNAFTYVNEGNLKSGDELGFMIDPELEERMKSYSRYKGPTILLIDKKNNQVVGSLDESSYSVDRYEGLSGLEERIKAEFAQSSDKNKRFIATPTTRVSQIMVGKIPYSTEERSLANIPNVLGEGRTPIFGIIKNGVMTTNDKLDDGQIIKPLDMSQKEGRMYLLIPNAAGKYSPAAVRVKHFNRTEFNPEDIEVQNTQVFKNIQESINKLANSLNEEDLNNAIKSLKVDLHIPNKEKRDIHIDWFTSNAGNGIRFTKTQRDAQGNEVYEEVDGKKVRKETVKTVFLTEKQDSDVIASISGNNNISYDPALRNTEDIAKEITEILLDFNLPIQVNLGMLNKGGYNNVLINSNVLTSNISDARVLGSWFTTDYFDIEGNLHQAISPASITPDTTRKAETPVGGTEGVITGTKVIVGGTTYGVDLTTGIIYGSNNQRVYPKNAQLIMDIAWADANFNNATNGSLIWNNKILLPSGQVLDRRTQKYLTGKEAQEVKDKIAGRKRAVVDSKKVITQIAENQKKVDKARTDSEFYYILEEDGQYHKYERVHSRLGSNWIESKKQTDALKDIRLKLSQLTDNITQYNDYLKYLSKHWKVDLSAFSDKIDARSRDTIVNIIRDSMSGTKSQRALNAGIAVDSVVRGFFTSNDTPVKPDNMNEEAFSDLISSLTEIRSNIEARGERFLTNNIVVFQKYPDGTRIAGEVDILSVDSDGNFRIYDIKTSGYSFYDFTDKYGSRVNYFLNSSSFKRMSSKDYFTLQLSAYKNLFESQYHTPITTLAILPFVLNYNKDTINKVTKEKGIIITYNPSVNVPLVSSVSINKPTSTNSAVPIFNSVFETQDPVNNVLPEYSLEDSKVGYFIREGKLHKSYLAPIGKVNGIDIYITKIPNITKGFGRQGESAHVASNSYMAVFPNGNSITIIENDPLTLTEQQVKDRIKKKLEGNPQRAVEMSNEKTLIFDPSTTPIVETPKTETSATILSTPTESGAAVAVQREQAIMENDDEFEDDLRLRKVDNEIRDVWDQEKELTWVKKVLPQLSDSDRVRVVKGLIRVGNQGALAWGQFNSGIITLSDIAAEGTAYHEAFHAVFNLLLDNNERQALLTEAKEMYGDKDDISLEEDMAEGFREYVMTRESRSIGRKILDFFKDLLTKIIHWNAFRPSLINYYQRINAGKYANSNFKVPIINELRSSGGNSSDNEHSRGEQIEVLIRDTQRFLDNFGITIKDISNYEGELPLFDALNRVLNIRSAEDITDGVGEAIAFMMQYDPNVREIISVLKTGSKSALVRYNFYKPFKLEISNWLYRNKTNKSKYLRYLGEQISQRLRDLYNLKPIDRKDATIWNIIVNFFKKLNPFYIYRNRMIANMLTPLITNIKDNDAKFILSNYIKPGTTEEAEVVDIGRALKENPYEESIVSYLNSKGISLAGGASIASQGTLYRPKENPLHDLDFNAVGKSKNDIEDILSNNYNWELTNTIIDRGGKDKTTLTYLVMDREFIQKREINNIAVYTIYDKSTGEKLGTRAGSNLILNKGVKGKMLDFFIGRDNREFPDTFISFNGKRYLFADYRNAFKAKITWAREKDIWDYNRFKPYNNVTSFDTLSQESKEMLLKKGWTQEKFNSISQQERDQAVKCITL